MDTSKNTDINIVKYKGFDSLYEKVETVSFSWKEEISNLFKEQWI